MCKTGEIFDFSSKTTGIFGGIEGNKTGVDKRTYFDFYCSGNYHRRYKKRNRAVL